MKVRVLTAQPKLTGLVAGSMPILVVLGLHFINPDHANMLLYDPAGVVITKIVAVLEVLALLSMYRMLRVDY